MESDLGVGDFLVASSVDGGASEKSFHELAGNLFDFVPGPASRDSTHGIDVG